MPYPSGSDPEGLRRNFEAQLNHDIVAKLNMEFILPGADADRVVTSMVLNFNEFFEEYLYPYRAEALDWCRHCRRDLHAHPNGQCLFGATQYHPHAHLVAAYWNDPDDEEEGRHFAFRVRVVHKR